MYTLAFSQQDELSTYVMQKAKADSFRDYLEMIAEPSTISGTKFLDYHQGIKKAYLFNGEFQLPVTLGGKKYLLGKNKNWVQSIQFIPQVKVRIFQNDPSWKDNSKPVRTPSYIPKISYYISPMKLWNKSAMHYVGLSAAHHSNGQDGWEFVADTVNLQNGSFSESLFFQLSTGAKLTKKWVHRSLWFNKLERKGEQMIERNTQNEKKRFRSIESSEERVAGLYWKLLYEFHPQFFSNQKFYDSGVYGGNRMTLNLTYKCDNNFEEYVLKNKQWSSTGLRTYKESLRVSFNLEYITDLTYYSGDLNNLSRIKLFDSRKRLNVVLTAYKRCLDSKYPAFFAQVAYYGSDNYNIYFQKSLLVIRCGMAFSFFDYQNR